MASKDIDEIVAIFDQLEGLNPRSAKEHTKDLSNKLISNCKISDLRKGSLSIVNGTRYSKGDSNFLSKPNQHLKSRKSLFHYDRSYSMNNLSLVNLEQQSFPKYSDQTDHKFDKERKLSNSKKMQHNVKDKINAYEILPKEYGNNKISKDSPDLDNYLDMISAGGLESVFDIKLEGLLKTKDSIEVNRKIFNKYQLQREQLTELDKASDKRPVLINKSPRPSVSKKPSISTLPEINTTTEISNDIPLNKTDSNQNPFSSLNEGMNSSESCSDLSDSVPMTCRNDIFEIETDGSTLTDGTERGSVSSKNTNNFTEIKAVKSEEEKATFLRQIAKDISMKSYSTKEIIRFNMENGTFSSQIIDISQTASSVCVLLKNHFNINPSAYWQIIEIIQADALERPLEDHENILDVYYSWKNENHCNRFIFRENPNMYKIFLRPDVFNNEMECDFEIEDVIWVKEANSRWKKVLCFISDTTVYFKLKPESKNHRDFYVLVNLKNFDFYTCIDISKIKKSFKAPTNELIVFKSNKLEHKSQEHPCICAPNGQIKIKWMESLKIAKFSFHKLKQNYLNFERKSETISRIQSFCTTNSTSTDVISCPSSI